MNVNIYLEENLAHQLDKYIEQSGTKRNAIIREAIKEWLARRQPQKWPDCIMNFKGDPDFPPFESFRENLLPPKEDPLA
jgi:hypothetical protein